MGKLIAVWGSPGSGKTTFSVKLAEALYNRSRGKSAVIVVFTDIVTPTIPVIFPNFRSEDVFSVGTILSKPDFFADDVVSNMVMTKDRMNLGYLGYKDIPEDAPYKYVPTEIYVPNTDKTRFEILKQYAEYDRSKEYDCGNEFVLGGDIPQILKKYDYSKYINGLDNTNDEIVFRLLDFVCDHFGHNGSGGLGSGRSITDLIEFCERNDNKSNCRGLAILLAALLRLNGIKAQHITCLPYEDPFEDCHVVVDCLLPSGKRIMLDPTWRLYLKDKEGNYVSLSHLRELLLADEPIFENPTADYNGTGFAKEYHRNYMIKNTFRFARCTLNKEGIDGRRHRDI